MALALIPTVSAADGYKITINNTVDGYTYAAYQILKGDLYVDGSTTTLSNIEWGNNIDTDKLENNYFKSEVASVYAEYLASRDDEVTVNGEADKLAKCLKGAPAATDDYTDGKYELTGLEAGYYLIMNTAVPTGTAAEPATDTAYTDYILQVVKDVAVEQKASVPSVKKYIVEGNDDVEINEASIGDEVSYKIVGTLPSTLDDYNTYFYKFTDTLSKGLTYVDGSMKITVNGVDVTDYFYKGIGTYDANNGTTIIVSIQDILALSRFATYQKPMVLAMLMANSDPKVGDVTSESEVIITYSATLNENANIGTANDNSVVLTYSNDPNNSGESATEDPKNNPSEPTAPEHTGVTPKDTVSTYTTEIKITKKNDSDSILTGAEFKLTGDNVKTVIVTANSTKTTINGKTTEVKAYVGSDGILTFTGLGAGTYTITETTPPAGYNTCAPVSFTVEFNQNDTKGFTVSVPKDGTSDVKTDDNKTLYTTIVNKAGTVLPTTGGIGTTIFYVIGGLLAVGAVVFFVTKRRMSEKN